MPLENKKRSKNFKKIEKRVFYKNNKKCKKTFFTSMISRERCVVHVDGMLLSTRRGGDQSHVDSGKG